MVSKKGVVTAKKKGSTKIVAKVGAKKLTCKITVKKSSLSLNATSKTLIKGNRYRLQLSGSNKTVKWSSSNKKVATVNKNGVVTAKKKGTAKITAKVGKKTCTCKVTVKNPHKDVVAYQENVKADELIAVTDYQIQSTGNDTFTVSSSANKNLFGSLQEGDVFILPSSKEHPDGYAGKVTSVENGVITAETPILSEIYSECSVEGTLDVCSYLSSLPATQNTVKTYMLAEDTKTLYENKKLAEGTINLAEAVHADTMDIELSIKGVTCTISNPMIDYKVDLKNKDFHLYLSADRLEVGVEAGVKDSLTVLDAPIPLGPTGFSVDIVVKISGEIGAGISLDANLHNIGLGVNGDTGFEKDEGFYIDLYVNSNDTTFEYSLVLTPSVGAELRFAENVKFVDLNGHTGINFKGSHTDHFSEDLIEPKLQCEDSSIFVTAGLSLWIGAEVLVVPEGTGKAVKEKVVDKFKKVVGELIEHWSQKWTNSNGELSIGEGGVKLASSDGMLSLETEGIGLKGSFNFLTEENTPLKWQKHSEKHSGQKHYYEVPACTWKEEKEEDKKDGEKQDDEKTSGSTESPTTGQDTTGGNTAGLTEPASFETTSTHKESDSKDVTITFTYQDASGKFPSTTYNTLSTVTFPYGRINIFDYMSLQSIADKLIAAYAPTDYPSSQGRYQATGKWDYEMNANLSVNPKDDFAGAVRSIKFVMRYETNDHINTDGATTHQFYDAGIFGHSNLGSFTAYRGEWALWHSAPTAPQHAGYRFVGWAMSTGKPLSGGMGYVNLYSGNFVPSPTADPENTHFEAVYYKDVFWQLSEKDGGDLINYGSYPSYEGDSYKDYMPNLGWNVDHFETNDETANPLIYTAVLKK